LHLLKIITLLWFYDGATWVVSGATGDIEGVTAGTGISGGGTSGTVTITNSMATEIDAKGDLVVGTGADTFARLAVGTDGYTLVADSVEATGLKWAAPAAGGGKVLQVVYGSTTTITDITSGSYADTSLSATITPSAASSKVLIFTSQTAVIFSASLLSHSSRILRGATAIFTGGVGSDGHIDIGSYGSPVYLGDRFTMTYLDSPNTTSATTYKTQGLKFSTIYKEYAN
jgi:hypothetical protein